ncbi:MAG: hypothetical protein ILO68_00015 [Clostridia bacterium]|nr:hypothetical protein [Clostridia bacterium]
MRQRIGRFFTQFGVVVVLVGLSAYLVVQMTLGIGDIVETEYTTYTSYTRVQNQQGFLFRDETPVFSPSEGASCFLVSNGECVSKGDVVAVTYSDISDVDVQEQITKIDYMIRLLEQSQISEGASTTDLSVLDGNIQSLTLDFLREVDDDNLAKALRSEETLWIQMNRRQALLNAETVSYGTRINQLKSEKQSLEDSMRGEATRVAVTKPGYFYTSVDGYEESFTISALENLTVDGFKDMCRSEPDRRILDGACGKLVNSSQWYVATVVNRRTAAGYKNGESYEIVFPYSGSVTLRMELSRKVSHTEKDEVVLVFSTREIPNDFDFTRSQTIQLVLGHYEGIRVSTKGLRMLDGEVGCYVLNGSVVGFKKAEILHQTDDYAICQIPMSETTKTRDNRALISATELSLYDTVILTASDLYVGKVIK